MSWDATDSPGMGRIQQSLQNQGLSAHHHQAATNSCGLRAVQRAGTDGRASPRLHRSRRCCHVLQVRRKTPGPTPSAPQAGNSSSAWTPSPAACKAPLRRSVSSRRKKSTKPPCSEPKYTAELEEREGWLLAARCLLSGDRFQQGWGHATGAVCARSAPALPEGTSPPETLLSTQM